jgi:collagenase-like PrtC family protease
MGNFKISAPFFDIDQIVPLKKAGVEQLYCGYVDKAAEKLWPSHFFIVNRRGKGSNFESFTLLSEAVKKADNLDLPVYVTMNGIYTFEQYPVLLNIIKKVSSLPGVKGLILNDMGLFLTLKKSGYSKKIHISTGGVTLNSYTADFYGSLGADRVILDRQLTGRELINIIKKIKTGVGIEVFIMGDPCLFIDGYCVFSHYIDSRLKMPKVSVKNPGTDSYTIKYGLTGCRMIERTLLENRFEVFSVNGKKRDQGGSVCQRRECLLHCNLCSLYMLKDIPGITLKVAGRDLSDNSAVVKTVSMAICLLNSNKNISFESYKKKAEDMYFNLYRHDCNGSNCYMPACL